MLRTSGRITTELPPSEQKPLDISNTSHSTLRGIWEHPFPSIREVIPEHYLLKSNETFGFHQLTALPSPYFAVRYGSNVRPFRSSIIFYSTN